MSSIKPVLLALIFLLAGNLNAQEKDIYKIQWKRDGIIIGTSALGLGLEHWISRNYTGLSSIEISQLDRTNINGFDRPAILRYNENAAEISDYFRDGILILPLGLMFSKQGRREWKDIGFLYFETILVNTSLTAMVKSTFRRNRPFTYNQNVPDILKMEETAKRSFYSGHTSHVTALSFFTATVLNDLHPDCDRKWMWWTPAILIPGVTAYLRYDAGRHFPTDLITGYAVGALVGYFIPRMHRVSDSNMEINVIPVERGLSLGIVKRF